MNLKDMTTDQLLIYSKRLDIQKDILTGQINEVINELVTRPQHEILGTEPQLDQPLAETTSTVETELNTENLPTSE